MAGSIAPTGPACVTDCHYNPAQGRVPMSATLSLPGDIKIEDAKPENIAHALAQPRDDDWYMIVSRDEKGDDYIEVSTPDGIALELMCEVGEEYLEVQSHLEPDNVQAILADFTAGGEAWRQMAHWAKPAAA